MVRSVSRSRGCALCLRRKIKCDERRPECSQCRRVRKPCPGVYGGLFMVTVSSNGMGNRLQDHAHVHQSTEFIGCAPTNLPVEPSYRPLFEQALVSTFISSFSVSGSEVGMQHDSWTKYLSSFVSSSQALGWSIRATTLAFYAQVYKEENLRQEAGRCYLHALRGQSASVSQWLEGLSGQDKSPEKMPTEKDILTSLMLLYYELICPASIGSWVAHLRGTTQLLILRGPQHCQVGAAHFVFRSIRLLLAQASVTIQERPCLSSPEWSDIPFALSGKTALDNLLDALHEVAELLQSHRIQGGEGVEALNSLRLRLESLPEDVELCEPLYLHELHGSDSSHTIASYCRAFQLIDVERLADEIWLGGGDFSSTSPAVMFHTIRVLVNHLKFRTVGAIEAAEESKYRCCVLLNFAHALFHRNLQSKLNEGACMQLVFLLEVVRGYSVCDTQRAQAGIYLHRLGWKIGPKS